MMRVPRWWVYLNLTLWIITLVLWSLELSHAS